MLSFRMLPVRNLLYHRLANLPVLLGVAVGAAVLAGALIVGDSLRGSLQARAERQLNGVQAVWIGTRLARTETLAALPQTLPLLLLRGSVSADFADRPGGTISGVTVIGLSPEGYKYFQLAPPSGASGIRAMASANMAKQLDLEPGGKLRISVQRVSDVPQSSLLGKRDTDNTTASLGATIDNVLSPDHPLNDFNLTPSPASPVNLIVPLATLQDAVLISGEDRRAIRNPELIAEKTNRVNAAISFASNSSELNRALAQKLDLPDWGLKLRTRRDPPFGRKIKERDIGSVSIESDRMLLEPAVVNAIEAAAKKLTLSSARTTSYLANDIEANGKVIPYSIVAAVDASAPAPLGPFLPSGVSTLMDDQIVLVDWPASPLKDAKSGDLVTLKFFKPELETGAVEDRATFRLAGFIPLSGPAANPNLTPPFPGITDRLLMNDWKPPFPYDNSRIKSNDIHDQFWQDFRTTPKAYLNRAAGEKLFGSRFGTTTTVRIAPLPNQTAEQTAEQLSKAIRRELDAKAGGFVFESTRERLLAASKGGTDFGMLLLMFSFLLIGAALLLVGLLFRLSVERRAKEVGLLLATGYSPLQVLRLLQLEGNFITLIGAMLGVGCAVFYADGMLKLLAALWPDENVQSYLKLHIRPITLLYGMLGAQFVTVLTIWFALRKLVQVPPPLLLRGQTQQSELTSQPLSPRSSFIWATVCAVFGGISAASGGFATNPDMRAGAFFSGGGLFLIAGLLLFRAGLRRRRTNIIGESAGLNQFGLRSTTRNASRSLLTVALIAFATFLLVAVESFRKKPGEDFLQERGGSGGFRLIAEADSPLFAPPDSVETRETMLNELQGVYQQTARQRSDGKTVQQLVNEAEGQLKTLKSLAFRFHGGDDASCLNLYQAGKPRVIGVPDALMANPVRFAFAQTQAKTPEERENPWLLLGKTFDDGAIPVIAEQNTVLWQLKTFVGSDITMSNEAGEKVRFRIVGTLQDSVFQSELLISDEHFRKLYPRTEGFRLFLLDAPEPQVEGVQTLLTNGLRKHGFQVMRTADKVAAYQAVIGAYLTTFQLLGGFGLLLGVLGLGIVILRGVHERTGELALLRSVGYTGGTLQRVILIENLLLLSVGIGVGLVAAILAVLPNMAFGGSIPWLRLTAILGAVLLTGVIVAVLATQRVSRVPLIPALRKE